MGISCAFFCKTGKKSSIYMHSQRHPPKMTSHFEKWYRPQIEGGGSGSHDPPPVDGPRDRHAYNQLRAYAAAGGLATDGLYLDPTEGVPPPPPPTRAQCRKLDALFNNEPQWTLRVDKTIDRTTETLARAEAAQIIKKNTNRYAGVPPDLRASMRDSIVAGEVRACFVPELFLRKELRTLYTHEEFILAMLRAGIVLEEPQKVFFWDGSTPTSISEWYVACDVARSKGEAEMPLAPAVQWVPPCVVPNRNRFVYTLPLAFEDLKGTPVVRCLLVRSRENHTPPKFWLADLKFAYLPPTPIKPKATSDIL